MLPATHFYVAHGDILNEKTPFNASPGEGELERRSNFAKLGDVYLWKHTVIY
jgi:hypothetical protein